jgi:hypothetical protein
VDFLIVLVPQHQAVVTVPQHEGFRGALDGVEQPLVCLYRALLQAMLLGDVHGNADQVGLRRGRIDHLRAGPHPQIVTVGMAHAEQMVDLPDIAARHHLRNLVEVAVVRVDQMRGFAEGNDAVAWRKPEDLVHRPRPVDTAPRHVPVPQAAASA